jgi:hypothetical protein
MQQKHDDAQESNTITPSVEKFVDDHEVQK